MSTLPIRMRQTLLLITLVICSQLCLLEAQAQESDSLSYFSTDEMTAMHDTVQLDIVYWKKRQRGRTISLKVGNKIRLKTWDGERHKGIITDIGPTSISVDGLAVEVDRLKYLYGKKKLITHEVMLASASTLVGISFGVLSYALAREYAQSRRGSGGSQFVGFVFFLPLAVAAAQYAVAFTVIGVGTLAGMSKFNYAGYQKELYFRTTADLARIELMKAEEKRAKKLK